MLDSDDDAVVAVAAAAVRAADVAVDVSRTGDIIIHSMECDSQCFCFFAFAWFGFCAAGGDDDVCLSTGAHLTVGPSTIGSLTSSKSRVGAISDSRHHLSLKEIQISTPFTFTFNKEHFQHNQ
jgi:hypothetical protein